MVRLAKPGEANYTQCAILCGAVFTGNFCVVHPSRKPTSCKWRVGPDHAGALVKKRPARPGQHMPHPCGRTHTRPDMEREEAGLDLETRLGQRLGIRAVWIFHGGGQLDGGRAVLEVLNFLPSDFQHSI